MYRCPKLVDVPVVVELPSVMYKMPVFNVKSCPNTAVTSQPSAVSQVYPDASVLEARQEAVLRRLEALKIHLDTLQSTRRSSTTTTTTNSTATTTATAAATTTALGAAALSSPLKASPGDLLRQQESVLYRLGQLKVKLGHLMVKEEEVKEDRPLTLTQRHQGILQVIAGLREELCFLADLQKWMAQRETEEEEKMNRKEEEEEEELLEKHHRIVLTKIDKLKQELKSMVDELRQRVDEDADETQALISACGCLNLDPLTSSSTSSSAPPLPISLPSSSSSTSSLISLLPPPPPPPPLLPSSSTSSTSSSSSSTCKMENTPSSPMQDVVVSASPSAPPLSLLLLCKAMDGAGLPVYCTSRVHSSLDQVSPSLQAAFRYAPLGERTKHTLSLSIQWAERRTPSLMVSPLRQTVIEGEANILRYLSRLFPATSIFNYEATGRFSDIADVDELMDDVERMLGGGGGGGGVAKVIKVISERLVRSPFLCGVSCGLPDVLVWSLLRQRGHGVKSGSGQVVAWMTKMDAMVGLDLDSILPQQQQQQQQKENRQAAKKGGKEEEQPSSPPQGKHMGRKELEDYLGKLGISYQVKDHAEVFTVDQLMGEVGGLPGVVTKNLFLKDKKRKLYLLSTKHDTEIDLKKIAKLAGTKDLRFADEDTLLHTLGVRQGCVSALALLNDPSASVTLLLESSAVDPSVPLIHFHPMSNSATLGLTPADLTRFLDATGHAVTLVNLG